MKYGTPKCPECGEVVAGEVDLIPGRSEVDEQPDGSFEYSGHTEVFLESQVNERDWDAQHSVAKQLAAALGNLLKMVEDGDYTTIELDEARMALAKHAAAAESDFLVTVECPSTHRWDTTKNDDE